MGVKLNDSETKEGLSFHPKTFYVIPSNVWTHAWNIKKLIVQFACILRDESFKPN
jgi:hypothetical protein